MSKLENKRLHEGALSALRTPEKLPEKARLMPFHVKEVNGPFRPEDKATDTALVQQAISAARTGDVEGMEYLQRRYANDVFLYVASFVRDDREAEDITQNVFAKLAIVIKKYEQREVPFEAWILRVARNAALDHLRAKRTTPGKSARADEHGGAQSDLDRGRTLRAALEELPEDQREVLVLRHIVGLSPAEIADTVGKTESSVHGLHHRGRRALRESLQENQRIVENLLREVASQ